MHMRIAFVFPEALWLLGLLPLVWAVALLAPRRLRPLRFWASLLVRSALLVTLVLALAGTQTVRQSAGLTTVFLIDRSDSVPPEARVRAEAFVQAAAASRTPGDRVAVVGFGARALVEQPPADEPPAAAPASPGAEATDIGQAIELGLGLLPADTAKRLVLLSDGAQTGGEARRAAEQAATRGVPISYVDLSAAPAAEALALAVQAPATVRLGQQFNLTAVVHSSVAQSARLRLLDGDQVLFDQQVALVPGQNYVPASAQARAPGFQRYRAELTPAQDSQQQNNAAEALVRVDGAARVLLVEGGAGVAEPLQQALAAAQVTAERILPEALPTDLAALSQYDALVLVDVPATALPEAAMQAIPSYVRDQGRGLVMVGGPRSYGSGGYNNTPIEQALPVHTDVRVERARPDVAIIFVLDKSGSMAGCHCNGPRRREDGVINRTGPKKIDFAKEAILKAAALLKPSDTVGVVGFDKQANWLYVPQQNASVDAIRDAISPVRPDGPSNLFGGLYAARLELDQIDAPLKHVVVMTDGWAQGNDPLYVAQELRDQGITLSVIADGIGAAPYLKDMAATGGGRFFVAQDMNDAPSIFVQEVQQIAGNYLVEQPFTPAYGADTPILAGLRDGLPPLYGYNSTTAKENATVALYGVDDAPVLAQWQYGLGRTVAWTSDTQGRWGKDWLAWPAFPRFAAQLVGWTLPVAGGQALRAEVRSEAGRTVVAATVQDERLATSSDLALGATLVAPDGTRQPLAVVRSGPGSYRAAIDQPPPGAYLIELEARAGDQTVARETAGLAVSYPPEYSLSQGGPQLLEELARTTGGTRLDDPALAFARDGQSASITQEIGLPLLVLALVLLAVDVVLRRLFALPPRAS
ncbi:MAG: VWA domain-containing protein [Roseiflexaceae bacterium]